MKLDGKGIRPEVLAALSQLPEVTEQARELANQIKRDAQGLAPKKTGRLRRGIAVERVYDEQTKAISYIVGWTEDAFYGLLVEEGSEDTPPRPHLVPAAIKNGAQAPHGGSGQ